MNEPTRSDRRSWRPVPARSPVPRCFSQVLTFRVGNHPGVLNPSPAVEVVQVRFLCAHPASLSLTPVYKVPAGAQPCPLPQHNKQLVSAVFLASLALPSAMLQR